MCELAKNKPVSVESNGNTVEEIVNDAKNFTSIASNVVAKVPMTADGIGLESVAILSKDNIPTNVTAMMNLNQLMLATKAGATYVSLFFNRARDAGEDPVEIIKQYITWTEKNNFKSKLIVGSIRKPFDVEEVASAGAHIITITPNIMEQLPYHAKTEETLKEFDDAWKEFTSSQS